MRKLMCMLLLAGTAVFLQTGCDELKNLGLDIVYYSDSGCCGGGYYDDVYLEEYWYDDYWYEEDYYSEDTWYDGWFSWW